MSIVILFMTMTLCHNIITHFLFSCIREHSEYGLSQWEMTLHCNVISHWLSPYPEWSPCMHWGVRVSRFKPSMECIQSCQPVLVPVLCASMAFLSRLGMCPEFSASHPSTACGTMNAQLLTSSIVIQWQLGVCAVGKIFKSSCKFSGIILCMCPANEGRHYNVMLSPIGWVKMIPGFLVIFSWILFRTWAGKMFFHQCFSMAKCITNQHLTSSEAYNFINKMVTKLQMIISSAIVSMEIG